MGSAQLPGNRDHARARSGHADHTPGVPIDADFVSLPKISRNVHHVVKVGNSVRDLGPICEPLLGIIDDRLHIERLGAGVARLLSFFDVEGIPVQAELIDTLNGYLPQEIHHGATVLFHDCSERRLPGRDVQ